MILHAARPCRSAILLAATLLIVLTPLAADAQRRAAPRSAPPRDAAITRTIVMVRGVAYPRYVLVDPWYRHGYVGPWYQYPYPGRYPGHGPSCWRDEFTSALRIEVTPKQAQVFVDGYFAGDVGDFDGVFQRLRLRPGGHEIAIYLEGHRTLRRAIYARPNATEHIRGELEPLGPGESSELPVPADPPDVGTGGQDREPRPAPAAWFGTLLLRVQPADAEILIDGERWSAPEGGDRLSIRLPEGRHRVEVGRDGFARYAEDVLIRRGATLTLNVSLNRGGP